MRKTCLRPGRLLLAALAIPIATPAVHAQERQETPSTFLATADSLASLGDTAWALATLERAVRRFPNLAAAHYRRGVLLSRTSSGNLADHFRRRSADGALERALQLDPNNPTYLLEMGRLKLKTPFFRIDAGRMFRRALAAARARGDAQALADIAGELGDIYLRRADISANRRFVTRGPATIDPEAALEDPRYTEQFLANQTVPVPNAGESDRREAEEHYRSALAAVPSHDAAARGLLALIHDALRYEEFLTTARTWALSAPGSARARLALGLGLARIGQIEEASAVFDSALALLGPGERQAIAGLSPILRRADARRYEALTPEERREFERLFWTVGDPLRLTAVNEYRVEHLARVAYADLRFSSTELGLRGWETDRGVIYIRYGPPPVVASFAPPAEVTDDPRQVGRVTTVWWYPERRLRFVFYGTPGYNVARFAGDFAAFDEVARAVSPARYDNLPLDRTLDSIPVQVARFRDSVGGTTAVLYAGIPVARILGGVELLRSEVETGLFVVDGRGRRVVERRQRQATAPRGDRQFEVRTFEVPLPPGDYHYHVEALELGGQRAARGASRLELDAIGGTVLAMSDVVLADRVAPRWEAPRSRRDFLLDPSPAVAFAPGQPLHLLWEIYGLRPDSAGTAAYGVSLTVQLLAIERRGVMARLVGGAADLIGITGEGEARVVLTYRREAVVRDRDRLVEHLAVDLGASPPGRYLLTLTLEDRQAGRSASRTRTFTITLPPQP